MLARLSVAVLLLSATALGAKKQQTKLKPALVDLLHEWMIPTSDISSSSSEPSNICVQTIEKVQKFSAVQFQGCNDLKSLCSPCSSCTHFTTLSQADPSKKMCVCSLSTDVSGSLSGKDDCFISPFGNVYAAAFTLDMGNGDDCAIVVGASQTATVTINGGAGNDILLNIDDQNTDVGAGKISFNGDGGDDCIYLQDNVQAAMGGAGSDVLILDDASGDYDVVLDGGNDKDFIVAVPDLAFGKYVDVYGKLGDDKIFAGGRNLRNIYGDEGADEIFLLSNAVAKMGIIMGGDGADYIDLSSEAFVYKIYGGDGDDSVQIHGFVSDVYLEDGSDNIAVSSGGHVYDAVDLGENSNVAIISGKVGNIAAGDGNNIVDLESGAIVNGDVMLMDGDDAVKIASGAVVNGDLVVGDGVNIVDVSGAVQGDIAGGDDGNKIHIASSGSVDGIVVGDGDDTVVIAGRVVGGGVVLGDGYNKASVSGSGVVNGDILGGADNDEFSVDSSAKVLGDVNGAAGDNIFSVSGLVQNTLLGGADNDIFKLSSDASVNEIIDGAGYNIVYLSAVSNINEPLDLVGANDVCYAPYNYENIMDACEVLHQSSSSS